MTKAFFDCDPHAEAYTHRTEAEAVSAWLDDTQGLSDYADPEVRARFGDAAPTIARIPSPQTEMFA